MRFEPGRPIRPPLAAAPYQPTRKPGKSRPSGPRDGEAWRKRRCAYLSEKLATRFDELEQA